ncbi:HEAT repeat domain-containing protein [Actinoplanes subglobosus]|uniref:HEAT repeat domain-containing protein n=1 Tax=Actinoplanes subglobosus TaxID=1547892 RepID=A0ABV8ILG9_9ACTN
MTEDLGRLIALLDGETTDIAEGAKYDLIDAGSHVIEPLAAAVGSLEPFGQLSAIEIFEHFGDPTAGPALIGLLDSDACTVREWSADALGRLGVREAVPALRDAYRRQRLTGEPPDWSEPVAIRRALTVLGARREVVPPATAALRADDGSHPDSWPSARLADVIDDLADHDQVVLYFQLWRVVPAGTYWERHEVLDSVLDLTRPWRQVVEDARETALIEADAFVPRPELFATVEWIDHADL